MPEEDIRPVKRDKEEAKKFYDKFSCCYDLFIGKFEEKYRNRGLEALKVEKGDKVLEIGFGTGESILLLAEKVGEEGMVYGVDISSRMFNITLDKIKKAGLEDRVELFCSDGAEFKYELNFFEKIFISFTLELFSAKEIRKVLDNCWQMLKSEGKIAIVALSRQKNNLAVKSYEILHDKFPVYFDCRPIYVSKSLKKANFEIVKEELNSMFGLPLEIVIGNKG